ncbi:gamma-glutamyltransferase [Sinosporangium siamense]|nr:gamma-glutamyltransferase [Sinosporangium siamense]
MRKLRCLLIAAALCYPALAVSLVPAAQAGRLSYPRQPVATGHGGAVATEHPLASRAAIDVLNAGGNAVDAAVAASAVQSVVRPFSGGIGGGGFMQVYRKATNTFTVLDHRSAAAASFNARSFVDPVTGRPHHEDTVVNSGPAAGVPGVVKAWEHAVRQYGSGMSLATLLRPAVQIAERGFLSDANLVREITENAARFCAFPGTKALYLNADCSVPPAGTLIRNPGLAATYQAIGTQGSSAFYQGAIARSIAGTVNTPPAAPNPPFPILAGSMTAADLSGYRVHEYPAQTVDYRGYKVHLAPPPASGVTVGQALNILEGYDLANMPRAQALHYYLEASRRAFADQQTYLGDPATHRPAMPLTGLLSDRYAEQVRQRIADTSPQRVVPPGDPWPYDADPAKTVAPAPAAGKRTVSAGFTGLADASTWESGPGFTTTAKGGTGTTIDVRGEAGVMRLGAAAGSYARAETDMAPVADSELLTRFKIDDLGGDRRLRFWLRAGTWKHATSPAGGYAVEINAAADTVRLIRARDGQAVRGLATFPYRRTTGWQWLRFSVEGDKLKLRIWADGRSEPRQTWTGTLTDTSVPGKGKALVSAIELTGGASGGAFSVDDLKVTDQRPVAFEAAFTGMRNGVNRNTGGRFTTASGNGVSSPGAAADVRGETGRLHLDGPKFSYARAEAVAPQLTDGELLVRFRVPDPGGDRRLRFWLRAGDWNTLVTPSHGYGLEIKSTTDQNEQNIRLLRIKQGSSPFTLTGIHHAMPPGRQWLRFRADGEGLRAKIWADGAQEPHDWQIQRADTEITGPGRLLIGATEPAGGDFHVDDVTLYDRDALDSGGAAAAQDNGSTIHLTVADSAGNIVAYTHTLGAIGGNGMVVPGRGFLLNNELSGRPGALTPPGHPNAPRGGMRPLSTQSPTIVTKNGDPVLALGTPGGGTIVTTVLQILINHIDFGMTLPDAVAAPRLSQRNDNPQGNTQIEQAFAGTPEHKALGTDHDQLFDISTLTYGIGAVNAITYLPAGQIQAVSEPVRRGGGSAMTQLP